MAATSGLLAVLAVAVVGLDLAVGDLPGRPLLPLPWWAVASAFCFGQTVAVNVQVRREVRSVSLSEVPFVVGLFGLSGPAFLLARLTGGLAAQIVARRQYRHPLKLAFNAVLMAVEAVVGWSLFRLAADAGAATSPSAWWSAVVAAVAANVVGAVAVELLITRIEPNGERFRPARAAGASAPQAAGVALLGVIVVLCLYANGWATAPLLVAGAMLGAGYRAYANLSERHLTLERLYGFSQVVGRNPETDQVVTGVLAQVTDMLHADVAVITLFAEAGAVGAIDVVARRGRPVERRTSSYLRPDCAWLVDRVAEAAQPILLPRGTGDPAFAHWLTEQELREAMIAPLRGDSGVIGSLLVGDRLGEARGFDAEDLRLLETAANHAGVALRNGQLIDQLRHDSLHDPLTGLANRSHLEQQLERLLAEAARSGGMVAVGLLDLDAFKDVNDTLGHQRGDELLREVAQRILTVCPADATLGRLGGDEFAVLLPSCGDRDRALHTFGEVLAALQEPFTVEEHVIDVGGSIGVALAPVHGTSVPTLLKRADVAMYAAKQDGRAVVGYDPAHDTAAPNRLALVASLRQAIVSERLEVHVQPKISLTAGTVTGAEALVRWTDDERGVVPPDEFIPVAERSGLIRPLTDVVLREALRACAAWQPAAPGVGVAVNLSARSLRDVGLVDDVAATLRAVGLPGHLLTIEITESSVMADPASTLELLHRLRGLSVRLSIDDFGTGYSSLSYLRRLPVQEVKIDKSFVREMDENAEDAAIVRSIIELGHTLDMHVVAEGIERPAVYDLLRATGCDLGQGYLVSRPMPAALFGDWFRQASPGLLSAYGPAPARPSRRPTSGAPAA